MPQPAEIVFLMFELHHGYDLRVVVQSLDQRIVDYFAKTFGQGQMLIWRNVLAAEENDKVIQQGLADLRDGIAARILGQIDPADFRTQRPGHGANVEGAGR